MSCFFTQNVNAQAITNYAFSTGTTGTLEDLTTGSTSIMTGNQDDIGSAVLPIGFDFYFMGLKYTHFSANSNGQLKLSTSLTDAVIGNTAITDPVAGLAILFPMAGDNEVNGGMRMKLVGTKLVVEWTNFYAHYTQNLINAGNMQVWIHQDGRIEYVYGEIYNATNAITSRSIGLSSGNLATTAGYVTLSATPTFTAAAAFVVNPFPAGNATTTGSPLIANLGSSVNGSRRIFTFTPSQALATSPTAITFTGNTSTATTVNWVDSSTTESFFIVTRATDAAFTTGVVTTVVQSTSTAGTGTSYLSAQTGMVPNTLYYYKIVAANEATVPSAGLLGSNTTTAPGTYISAATGNWNAGSTWQGGIAPSAFDSATVSTGHTVTINAASLGITNLIVNGTLAYGTVPTSFATSGNLTVNTGGLINVFNGTTGKTLTVGGDVVLNGMIDVSIGGTTEGNFTLNGTTVQAVSGTGSFKSNIIRNLAFLNTTVAVPNVNWSMANIAVVYNLNLGTSKINLGGNKITFGNGAAGNTFTSPVGAGFINGKFSRYWNTTSTGSSITAGSDPTTATSRYPFVSQTGANRAMYISRTNATGAVAGEIAVVYNDANTITNGLNIADGTYTVNDRYNGNWVVSNEGTAVSASSYSIVLIAENGITATNGNARVIGATAAIGGAHQNGTTTPGAQRITLSQADLFAGPLYIGLTSTDVPFTPVANGNWNVASIWNKGSVPTCNDAVVIASGITVTSDSAGNVSKGILIASGGTLVQSAGDLTVGCTLKNNTLTNNGILTITGGTLNVNGNMLHNSGSTFNQSGGDINIDGNDAGTATNSVASGVHLLSINATAVSNLNLTAGTITIVDPPQSASTSTYALRISQGGAFNSASVNHTIKFGNGISNDASTTGSNGFYVYLNAGASYYALGNVTVDAGTTGLNRFVKSTAAVSIKKDLTITSGEYKIESAHYVAGNIVNNGIITAISTLNLGDFNGSALVNTVAQSVSGSGIFRNLATAETANLTSLTINNTAGATLNTPLSVSGTLTLTAGMLNTTNVNLLTLGTATAQGTLSGGSATSYINGPISRTISTANTSYVLYPVGKSAYAPISLAPTTTTVSKMKAEAFDSNTGTIDASITGLNASRRWEAPVVSGTITDVKVRVGDAGIVATNIPVQAPTATGIYSAVFGPAATFATGTPNTVQSNTGIAQANYTGFIGYATSNVCMGTPTPGNTLISATNICLGTSVTLSLQNVTPGTGVTYVWESSIDGTTYTAIANANGTTYVTTPTAALYYRASVTCSGSTATSVPVQVLFATNVTATTPNSRCGIGTVNLAATAASGSTIKWYNAATNGTIVGSGTTFVTPIISSTTSYYVASELVSAGAVTSGTATTLSGATEQPTAFCNRHPVYVSQTIYTAAELFALGLRAGNITSMAYNITTLGDNASNPNFSVKIGTTALTSFANANLLSTTAYTSVYGPSTYTHTASGWQVINFTTPYAWDGVSNIVINVSYEGSDLINNSQSYYTATTDSKVLFSITANPTTGSPTLNRLNTMFTGQVACSSPRVEVVATVTPPPALNLSTTPVAFCQGQSSTPVTLTSVSTDYDTYVWSPSTGVTGDATSGWIFNPNATTTYTLTASQSSGSLCSTTASITISVNPLPTAISISPSQVIACAGQAQAITATGGASLASIVSGTATTSSTASSTAALLGPNPLQSYYGGTKQQWIYTQSELTALGFVSGSTITSLKLDLSAVTANLVLQNLVVKMKNSTTAAFASTSSWETGMTTVRNAAPHTQVLGTNTFVLDTPFTWNGTGNLVVEMNYSNANGGGGAPYSTARYSPTTFVSTIFYRIDNATAATVDGYTGTASFIYSSRNNVVFEVATPQPVTWSPIANLYLDAAATTPYVSGNTASTVYFKSDTPAASVAYTATATSAASCSVSASVNVTVNAVVTPDFAAIPAFCSGSTAPTLATTSPNGVTGTWSPATVSNTTSGSYVFTPTAGQCANTQTLAVTVTSNTVPDFAAIPAFCSGSTAPTLATTSPNGVTGTWSPATVSNTTSGSYVFTPTAGQCANTQTLAVTVTTNTVPDFAAIPAFCSGSTAPTLGTTSPNGVAGTWSPATVNNTTSGTYVFTPTAGQCATTQTLSVTVTTTVAPTGTSPQDYTTGETLADFDVTGTGIIWYDAPSGGNVLPASTILVSNVTYYASQTVGGCESPTRLPVTAGADLKVDSFGFESLKYYPNPVSNVLTVTYSEEITGLKLYNMVGQELMNKKVNSTETKLDMSHLPMGSYLLEVSSGAKSKMVKLIKNQ